MYISSYKGRRPGSNLFHFDIPFKNPESVEDGWTQICYYYQAWATCKLERDKISDDTFHSDSFDEFWVILEKKLFQIVAVHCRV